MSFQFQLVPHRFKAFRAQATPSASPYAHQKGVGLKAGHSKQLWKTLTTDSKASWLREPESIEAQEDSVGPPLHPALAEHLYNALARLKNTGSWLEVTQRHKKHQKTNILSEGGLRWRPCDTQRLQRACDNDFAPAGSMAMSLLCGKPLPAPFPT